MTLVVADPASMSLWADTQITAGRWRDYTGSKLVRLDDGSLAGWSGDVRLAMPIVRWLRQGGDPDAAPDDWSDTDAVRLLPDGTVLYYEGPVPHVVTSGEFSIGSGGALFRAARMAGASIERAFEIVFDIDTGCGGTVERMVVSKPKGKR